VGKERRIISGVGQYRSTKMEIRNWLKRIKPVIGMVHLLPLPGSPRWQGSMDQVLERACRDAESYQNAGFHAVLVENHGDIPFAAGCVGPHTVAAMAWLVSRLKTDIDLPFGVNVLRNDWQSSLALASICGCAFIRVNVHSGAMLTDQGMITGNAHDCLRYRKMLDAAGIGIFADVLVKHAIPLGSEPDLVASALDLTERGLADAVIVSGGRTGEPAKVDDLIALRKALPDAAILAGSGIDAENIRSFWPHVDGVIVGTGVKEGRITSNPVSADYAQRFMAAVGSLHGAVQD
jgi:uncharacterized protein